MPAVVGSSQSQRPSGVVFNGPGISEIFGGHKVEVSLAFEYFNQDVGVVGEHLIDPFFVKEVIIVREDMGKFLFEQSHSDIRPFTRIYGQKIFAFEI